ncbi:uncharacterized protein MEPE_03194 [Melanopsichium pennsylvanicum]|uniref:Protein kinase domain-containing protein n=2 Tax=Melanopsichium pennsylvanicum TaxID=63383 RepID=A0AAJ4XKZ1_9BASI|nr:putative protein [Melanopsichium pennsylvanicum 4]SNX84485.1 uncharacterized protein MEPE_03194 [Melanopsichium pennsylvanicum]
MPVTLGDATEAGSSSSDPQGPPACIEFALGSKRLVRYNRMARNGDADAAVLGKGGFGCVYRFAIDTSFTPPSSMDLSLSLRSFSTPQNACDLESSPPMGLQKKDLDWVEGVGAADHAMKVPSLVAVKLCRTPCSGSFDELQKTGLVDKKTRRAEMQDDKKMHVRIVRGEGRIFQYLQAARQASQRSSDVPLVKLLANLSPSGVRREAQLDSLDVSIDEEDGPPTRLLVFEKLIELDAERTSQGWTRSKKTWSHERVEKAAFEVIQGLQFLHEHNVTHGDLKPSNLMLDPRTGVVKIIDLGASRRFVHLSNRERNNRSAVEEQDRYALSHDKPVPRLAPELCEGLGSLTGSPYYMAPEILLQATRYVDVSGRARSVLEDYEYDYPSFLPREQWPMYQIGLSDLRRGWGIRADIWSWACTVQALLMKTVEGDQRPSSSSISPYDFSFSRHRDEMIDPMFEKAPGEDDVPRFHQWCRVLPLLIVRIALEPVPLLPQADGCSLALRTALKASLRHQDLRPTADDIQESLEASRPSSARLSGTRSHTPNHMSPRPTSSDKSKRNSRIGAASDIDASPQTIGSELDGSRYATPPLSQGASSVSTPQHTCETVNKTGTEPTPTRDRKVRFKNSTAESASLACHSSEAHLDAEVDHKDDESIPHGFELVSPSRPLRMRPAARIAALRPATANAELQSTRGSFREARPPRPEFTISVAKPSRSHPSTPTAILREAICPRPRTQGDGAHRFQNPEAVLKVDLGDRSFSKVEQESGSYRSVCSPAPEGLGISWPLEDMRSLQLGSSTPGYQMPAGNISLPPKPNTHTRGASVPVFEPLSARSPRMPPPAALAVTRHADIGGSPRSFAVNDKNSKQNSLMATLKEKQVRLRQSSRKLMTKRAGGVRSPVPHEHVGGEAGIERGGTAPGDANEAHDHDTSLCPGIVAPELSPELSSRYNPSTPQPPLSVRRANGGTSSRRCNNRSGEAQDSSAPSKPLLKRLLNWSTNS